MAALAFGSVYPIAARCVFENGAPQILWRDDSCGGFTERERHSDGYEQKGQVGGFAL